MAKKKKKLQQRNEREAVIAQKEHEDNHGIKRRIRSGYNDGMSLQTLNKIKIILLFCLPLAYFLYSVLLLPIIVLYGLTYFVVRRHERNLNYGLRKDLWISLPKFDGIIALVLVVIVGAIMGLSALTTGTQNSMFTGKSEAQIYAILEARGMNSSQAQSMAERIADSSMTLTNTERLLIQAGTMLTGQRVLFETKNENTMRVGGAVRMQRPQGSGGGSGEKVIIRRPPDGGVARPTGSSGGSFNSMMVLSQINNIFSTVNVVLLLVVFAGGLFAALSTNKHKKTE